MNNKEVVKKDVYDEFIKQVNGIDTSGLVKKRYYDNKIGEIEGKMPSITGLATTAALTTVENKIPCVRDLARKQIMMINKRH